MKEYKIENLDKEFSVSHKTTSSFANYSYHRHDGFEIFIFLSGNVRFYIEQKCIVPSPDSIVILSPEEMHRIEGISDMAYERVVINISKEYVKQLSNHGVDLGECFEKRIPGQGNVRKLDYEYKRLILQYCREIERCATSQSGKERLRKDAWVTILLTLVCDIYKKKEPKLVNDMPEYIQLAMQYMEENLEEEIRLVKLEKRLHLPGAYISKQFKIYTGLTLREYFLDRKINHAKALLGQGANVTEACFQSGFRDYANFCRSFKKVTGVSPGKYNK